MTSASVIIPFYQREEGLLTRAVQSVLDQKGVEIREIIVVDDESPLPAERELAPLIARQGNRIRTLRQKNAGCGAARNTGMEQLARDVELVSFVDSDDVWFDDFLANAAAALGAGYDFFFSDFYFPFYKDKTAFIRAGKIAPAEHRRLAAGVDCYEYGGDMLDQILVTGNVIGASTIAYRFDRFPDVRYRGEYFNCQDYLFYMDFALAGGRFCFSTHPGCDCGSGVSIFSGAKWGSAHLLRRHRNEIKAWRFVQGAYALTAEQARANLERIDDRRRNFSLNLIHMLRHAPKEIDWPVVLDCLKLDPAVSVCLARAMAQGLFARLAPGRKPPQEGQAADQPQINADKRG